MDEIDYKTQNGIFYNNTKEKEIDVQKSFEIYNNVNDMPLSAEFYSENQDIYQQHLKEAEFRKNSEFYKAFHGFAAVAADGGLSPFTRKYRDELLEQEKLFVQQNFDERNFGYRLLKGIQSDLASRDVSRLYYEQSELEQQGLDTTAIKAEIAAKEQELAQIPTGADNSTVARGLASFAASMWDMKGILATDLALTAASSAATSIAATGGAAAPVSPFIAGAAAAAKGWKYVRPLFTGGASYVHSREVEIGSMLRELKAEGVDDADAREAAYLYGNVSSAIETLGFFGGVDIALGQVKKGIMSLVKSGNKEAIQQLVQKKFTKEAILDLAKSFGKGVAIGGIPSALSETGEEGLQGEVAEEVKARIGQGTAKNNLSTALEVLTGAYKRFGATSMEIVEHFINGTPLSEHASQMLDTYYSTFWGSFVGGGTVGGTGRLISTMATEYAPKTDQQKFRDAFTNTQKTNGFKEFIRKSEIQQQSPEAGNMITDKLLEANDLPKTLWIAEDALVEIINASQNDEELSALLAPLNLQEKIEKSVDGMVEVDINTSKVLFSEKADKVFKQLADNISWSQDALTPKQAKESLARTATDTMFGVQTGTVDSLERKLLESYPEEKRADKTTKELARGNAAVALHIANAMSGATGRSTQEIAEEILNNIVVGDDGIAAVDNVIKNTVLKQEGWHGGRELEGGKFSLKYAGKQTGLAHGYGVYASKQRNTAEDYRSRIDYNFTVKGENIASIHRKLIEDNEYDKASLLEDLQLGKDIEAMYEGQEVKNWYDKEIKPFLKSEGKLYKLELPEDFELINEQATFEEQPEDVQAALIATSEQIEGFGLLKKAIEENAYGGDLYIALGKDVFYEQKGYEGGSTEIQETASMYLDKLGVKGITYDGGSEGQNFVIFNPDNAKILDKFYQAIESKQSPTAAGYFDPATLEIRLTSASNPTTFAHELMHYFMFNMVTYYNNGTMTEEWRKQFEKAMKWAGAEKDANGMYSFDANDPKVKAAQEKLAEGFTSYIAKGKAPSKQTASLFNLLKDWFMYAYTSLKRKRVKLNKDVTKFYDKVFSINGDVESRLEAEKIGALSRPEGMTDEDWNKYMELKEQARGAAFGKALEAMVKAAKERLNDAYKAKKKELYEQKLAELTNAPEFIAWKRAKEEGISISSVEDVIGNGKRPYKNFLSETGVHINILVKDSGMQSVAEFVAFINSTKSPETLAEEYAKEQADLWMEERNPELKDIRSENAVRTVASIKVAVMEFMMLKGIPMSQFNTYFNEMKKATEAVIAQSEIRDIANTDKWHSRLINLLDRINVAQSQGDMNKLAQLKWRAAFINYIIIQSKDLAYQYDRFNKHFSKYKDHPSSQQLKSIEGKVWNLIGDALNRWGLTKRNTSNDSVKKRVDDYIDELLEYGYSGAESIKPYTYLLDNPERIRFKKITTSDFNKLRMVLGQLEIFSNMERKIVVEGKELYIKDAVDKVVASAKAKGIKAWNDKSNVVKELFVDFMGIPETQLAEILPSDVFQNFVLEFQNGLSKAERWKNDVSQRLYNILAPVMNFQNREVIIEGRGWKVSELMVMMLNMGNEHNLKCMAYTLAKQNKVSPENMIDETLNVLENAQAAISDAGMTGFDIRDVAQQVWDLFDEFVPDMKKAQERLDGKEITMVDAMPYTFLDGKTIRGGYYPARNANNVGSNQDAHNMTWVQKTFSMTIERDDSVHEIPTDLVLLNTWVSQMSKLLFVTEPANNIEKLAKSSDFVNALGSRTSRYIMDWLNTSIVPDKTSPFFARLSMLSSVYILGGKIVSLPVQMLGIVSAFVNVGYGRCLLSLGKLTTGTGAVQMVKQAKNKSVYMLNRFKNPMNHLLGLDDLGKAITPKLDKTQQSVIKTMMLAVTTGDMLACVTVWDAAYNKALEEGHSEEKAILIADHSVRITQGDTSAGARAKSMRSTLRFLSPFSSFFIAAHNLISSKVIWSPQKRMEAAVALFTLCVLAPLLETLVRAPFEFASMSDDERRRKKVHSITDYIKKRRGRNIAENTINIAFPAFGLAGEVMFYADRGYYSGGTVLPLTSLKKFASLPVDIVNYAKGERSDKAIDNFIDTLGLAIGGINRGNLEKTLRIFNIGE